MDRSKPRIALGDRVVFYEKLSGKAPFFCAVLGSIAGWVSSPLFSVYGATKSAVCKLIESVNVELDQYKQGDGRAHRPAQVKVGYLSGTFDLFHVGHLNLLKRAKAHCDYLVVGVHKDALHKGKEAFIPLEERMEIVRSIRYVDEVILSFPEDVDAYPSVRYDFLFVGSDYQGTERFQRYEEFLGKRGVQILYFPYTKETNSTQVRAALSAAIARA